MEAHRRNTEPVYFICFSFEKAEYALVGGWVEGREEGEGPGVSLLGIQPAGAKFEVFPQVLLIVAFSTFVWDKREFILAALLLGPQNLIQSSSLRSHSSCLPASRIS